MASYYLGSAKGRIWFGLFAGVREGPFSAQIEVYLFALCRYISLFVVGVATWVATPMFLEIALAWQAISRLW